MKNFSGSLPAFQGLASGPTAPTVQDMSLLLPSRRPLSLPGTAKRLLRRPDARGLLHGDPSGYPLTNDEVDYDDLNILRAWRIYHEDTPGEVKYFCYELEQTDPFAPTETYFKAVRLVRLTRVPRYLRNTGSHSGHMFTQMRDVLVGLREKRVLFVNLIAKSPVLPLVFAYGVQGTGDTLAEAMAIADEAYAALSINLDGTYQQLEYAPLKFEEAETLARYQAEWGHVSMARGRPMPQGIALGSSAILDGNRTDVENTNNQLESFIRGMGDRSFMLSLVTVPLTPAQMTKAWDDVTVKLSAARSDQSGSRGVSAGIALPLGMGMAHGDTTGSSHGVTDTTGTGTSDGVSASLAHGLTVSSSDTVGRADTVVSSDSLSTSSGTSEGTSTTLGQSTTQTDGVNTSMGQSGTYTESQGLSQGESLTQSAGQSESVSQSQGVSRTDSFGHAVGVSQSEGLTNTVSMSRGLSVSEGQSLSNTMTAGTNWMDSATQSMTAGQTAADSFSQSAGENLNQSWSLGTDSSNSVNDNVSQSDTNAVNGGIPGFLQGNVGQNLGVGQGSGYSAGSNMGLSQSAGGSNSMTAGSSLSTNLGVTTGIGESLGGSLSQAVGASSSVGTSESLTYGQSLASSHTNTVSESASEAVAFGQNLTAGASQGVNTGLAYGQNQGSNLGQSVGQTQSAGIGTSSALASGASLAQSASDGRSASLTSAQAIAQGITNSTSHTEGTAASQTATSGTAAALSRQSAMSDAWQVAMSRQATQTGSLGVVPTFSAQFSKNTYDEAKRIVGDLLEEQAKRYLDGIEGGGYLYQLFLVTPDRETLIGASSLLKSAFWGSGGKSERLTAPFHTVIIDDPEEAKRLITHAAAFSSYRKREPVSELIEPYYYSSFATTGEVSAFCHPPTSEASGLQAQTDSMPVLAMPSNRRTRDIYLGHIINGERGRVSDARFGVDLSELTHVLIQGVTGLGKTTTAMRLMEQAVRLEREIVSAPTAENPQVSVTTARAGLLVLDWMANARKLAQVVPADRFQLFSVSNPDLGAFRFNPLEIPHPDMDPGQWLGSQADNLASSFGLGQYGRSILSELLDALYSANRLVDTVLRPAVVDELTGQVLRPAIVLPAVNPADLPAGATAYDAAGNAFANVYTCSELSRLVGLPHVAVLVATKVEEAATAEGARLYGTEMRNRLQSVWRRIQYYAPGNPLSAMVTPDPSLTQRECLGVRDIIDPDRGLVTVIETDGLDVENRRVVLGSVMLAVYRYGLQAGNGCYDHGGKGPGTFIVLEEAHELLGEAGESEDRDSAIMRTALYESLFRRARATGLRLVVMTQNCGQIPAAITSQTTTVFIHRTYDDNDRKRVFSLLNWSNMIGQQQREWRYLGEMPRGYCIVRLDARESYLESAPVQILVDPPALPDVSNDTLRTLAQRKQRN